MTNLQTAGENTSQLAEQIAELIENAKRHVAAQVNSAMVCTYYEIGRMIVEYEQQGKIRAEYGAKIIPELAKRLTARLGKGFSKSNLANMRQFYIVYSKRFIDSNDGDLSIFQTVSGKSEGVPSISQTLSGKFLLSWSHYLFLMGISNPQERLFYEQEAANERWSLRELKRQFNSALYERLALSRNKKEVSELSKQGLTVESPADIVKDPYVLEFLGLPENSSYSESKLEECIIDELQNFLMELGKGYTFVGRQVRLTFEEQHFYVDLVFFNRILQCFVLIDLKIGDITHQDIGQMQMYVNYYDRKVKLATENPTVGILLCKKKNDALVEMTLPKDNSQIFASKYELVLPNKEELMRLLEEKFSED
jgi:predicted nuclease of restriction endonuclease-like (RecB) superfamily